jgi:hypothetical protein
MANVAASSFFMGGLLCIVVLAVQRRFCIATASGANRRFRTDYQALASGQAL